MCSPPPCASIYLSVLIASFYTHSLSTHIHIQMESPQLIQCNVPPTNRLFGFLLGSTLAGAGTYYYILEEYKVSNELLTEDIYVSNSADSSSIIELYERVAI